MKKCNSKIINVIKDNNYDFIKMKYKSDDILELLKLTIWEYLCDNLSKKYSDLSKNYNEKIIKLL